MENINEKIQYIEWKLSEMAKRQAGLSSEIQQVRNELEGLKYGQKPLPQPQPQPSLPVEQVPYGIPVPNAKPAPQPQFQQSPLPQPPLSSQPAQQQVQQETKKRETLNLEKFIGENLISKIGVIVLVIGVAFGVKYSIDNDLISPLVRILLGYLFGFGLLAFGIKLKKKYENYSAVLVGGAFAIVYFVTYSGYTFYSLFPQIAAFVMMFLFTVLAVFAAVQYNRQVIAHIGLVGAYAVPFLLSNDSNSAMILFVYITIINIGVVAISCIKYWKPLYTFSFALSWLIYFVWHVTTYNYNTRFTMAFVFLTVFFAIFYGIFLLYKLVKKERYSMFDMVLLLLNTFLFYGIGYDILNENPATNHLTGLFTITNAVIHSMVGFVVYRQRLEDKTLLYFLVALALAFVTIAVPVQLQGHWVTLLWTAEVCLLFIWGRVKQRPILEQLSYPMMFLAAVSLLHDWGETYDGFTASLPFIFNIQFLTSMLFVIGFAAMCYIHFKPVYQKPSARVLHMALPGMLLLALYFSIYLEIKDHFHAMWIFNYSLLFVSILLVVNIYKLKNKTFGMIVVLLSTLFFFLFLTQGIYTLSELRGEYLNHTNHIAGADNIIIRYISILFYAITLFIVFRQIKQSYMPKLLVYYDCVLYISLLWISSSELIHWLDMARVTATYKIGLSILWGAYALIMIVLGMWKKKKYLRFGAMALFGVTLLKLFFYDLSNLNTISKTIVMVILGIFLLLISFLYNKIKNI